MAGRYLDALRRLVTNADTREAVGALRKEVGSLRREVSAVRRELHDRLVQYHLQLGRLARAADGRRARRVELGRAVPLVLDDATAGRRWEQVGEEPPVDPDGRDWCVLEACPACGDRERTVVIEWNKLLLLPKAPDDGAARYDYAICHGCGVLYASRRPSGERYRFLLRHFGEVSGKRGGDAEISSPLLNPYPLTDADRDRLRRMVSRGAFVSDHLGLKGADYLRSLMTDRIGLAPHLDIICGLLEPARRRVLEVRSRTGTILDGLRRLWGADVCAMPIWESQRFILAEAYGIEASEPIDFDHFRIPFSPPFDLIICNHMLTHVIRPQAFFAELRDRLAPGGHVYLHNEPDDREFLNGRQSVIAHLNPLHMQAFDQPSLVRVLAANGFEVVFLKSWDQKHACLARRAEAPLARMTKGDLRRRVMAHQRARDRAILVLPEQYRPRVAGEWPDTVARAVASGEAEFDAGGQLRLVGRPAANRIAH